jgi:hypothetical protein
MDSYIEDNELSRSLSTTEFKFFSAVCFTLAIPLVLDQIIDKIMYKGNIRSKKSSVKGKYATDAEELIFIFGVIIVALVSYLNMLYPVQERYHNLAFIYVCCLKTQYILTIGVTMTSVCRYDKGFWPTLFISIAIVFLIFGMVCSAIIDNWYENKPVTRSCSFFWTYNIYIIVLSGFIFLSVCVHHMVKLFKNLKNTRNKVKPDSIKKAEKYDIFTVLYFATIFYVSTHLTIVYICYPKVINAAVFPLVLSSFPFGCCLLFFAVFLMRLAKFEMTEAVVSLDR